MKKGITAGPLHAIVDRAREHAANGMLHGRQWSLAQICEHLALALESTVDGQAPVKPRSITMVRRAQRWFFKQVTLRAAYIPPGVDAPGYVRPGPAPSLEQSLDRLARAADAFEEKFRDRHASWPVHDLLGRFSPRGWRRFHHVHAAHHFACLSSSEPDGRAG